MLDSDLRRALGGTSIAHLATVLPDGLRVHNPATPAPIRRPARLRPPRTPAAEQRRDGGDRVDDARRLDTGLAHALKTEGAK